MSTLRSCVRYTRLLRRCYTRYNSTQATAPRIPSLPDQATWSEVFPVYAVSTLRDRVFVRKPETAAKLAESFLSDQLTTEGRPKVVIETYPGPGVLSRALLELPHSKLRKLIILEDQPEFTPYLEELQAVDPRVTVIKKSGYAWDAYTQIVQQGLMDDVQVVPWENGIHPELHFISHLPLNIMGEQLIAQFLRCIPERSWLFHYGRVPMSIIIGEWLWQRMTAPPGNKHRCKLSVVTEATIECTLSVPRTTVLPYDTHFWPQSIRSATQEKRPESRRSGQPMMPLNLVPLVKPLIGLGKLDQWDFILRRLFVLKSTPIKRSIGSLAPGASTLLKSLVDPLLPLDEQVDVSKASRDLTTRDWEMIARAFDKWPFAPVDLQIDPNVGKDRHMVDSKLRR
ncbi:S-adenosyl-L-methionine-dependent methyltransferase [Obba rivulosa]|uniref:rRNA adenine N(6)-methyltransferase n=1 Tax=Obba rivulosa TaxID=1052685 RepID=A0A8E2DSF8_9APHY|nr:S-adenosyl-L-methionine-dependent methyltransferase [Obba rivulosa]